MLVQAAVAATSDANVRHQCGGCGESPTRATRTLAPHHSVSAREAHRVLLWEEQGIRQQAGFALDPGYPFRKPVVDALKALVDRQLTHAAHLEQLPDLDVLGRCALRMARANVVVHEECRRHAVLLLGQRLLLTRLRNGAVRDLEGARHPVHDVVASGHAQVEEQPVGDLQGRAPRLSPVAASTTLQRRARVERQAVSHQGVAVGCQERRGRVDDELRRLG
mmetsp:Transcript_46701/g.131395  ORF Transcript_46701/g.131395 Transcript_46701/m.131395 type:complete len:221 (-) Transcript_46701:121-783(-)